MRVIRPNKMCAITRNTAEFQKLRVKLWNKVMKLYQNVWVSLLKSTDHQKQFSGKFETKNNKILLMGIVYAFITYIVPNWNVV